MLFDWLDGKTPEAYGLDPALASLSPQQAKLAGLLTSGTSGPTGITSLESQSLASSLVSRLRQRMASLGSTLFTLTWKTRDTPSGLRICALRASGRRTLGSDSTSRPSPVVNDSKGSDYTYNQGKHDSISLKLGGAAKLASWPTAAARDWKSGDSNLHGQNSRPLNEVAKLATWPSPKANNNTGAGTRPTPMAGTPARNGNNEAGNTDSSRKTVGLVSGSPAPTEKRGQLNPAHSRWLMGFPIAWDSCGATAMQSLRPSRRSS